MDKGEGLTYRIERVSTLSSSRVEEMLSLFRAHFHVPNPEVFLRDLEKKDYVVQILKGDDGMRGFSTITSFQTEFRGRPVGVVYSGDTIICPECWGSSVLPRAWLEIVLEMAKSLPRPVYWLLLSSGYKTYRMLPVFFRRFFPRVDEQTPEALRALLEQAAREVAGDQYDPDTGIIRFQNGATPLRAGVADPDEQHRKNPHTAFFLERNPGHDQGDELVCLAEISHENLSRGGLRILRALGRERLE